MDHRVPNCSFEEFTDRLKGVFVPQLRTYCENNGLKIRVRESRPDLERKLYDGYWAYVSSEEFRRRVVSVGVGEDGVLEEDFGQVHYAMTVEWPAPPSDEVDRLCMDDYYRATTIDSLSASTEMTAEPASHWDAYWPSNLRFFDKNGAQAEMERMYAIERAPLRAEYLEAVRVSFRAHGDSGFFFSINQWQTVAGTGEELPEELSFTVCGLPDLNRSKLGPQGDGDFPNKRQHTLDLVLHNGMTQDAAQFVMYGRQALEILQAIGLTATRPTPYQWMAKHKPCYTTVLEQATFSAQQKTYEPIYPGKTLPIDSIQLKYDMDDEVDATIFALRKAQYEKHVEANPSAPTGWGADWRASVPVHGSVNFKTVVPAEQSIATEGVVRKEWVTDHNGANTLVTLDMLKPNMLVAATVTFRFAAIKERGERSKKVIVYSTLQSFHILGLVHDHMLHYPNDERLLIFGLNVGVKRESSDISSPTKSSPSKVPKIKKESRAA